MRAFHSGCLSLSIGCLCLLVAASGSAGTVYFPGEGAFGTLLFEDQWPCQGDFDFNDLVLRYNVGIVTDDASGAVESLSLTLPLVALGGDGGCDPGLGLHLELPAATPLSATVSVGGGPPQAVTPDPAETDTVLWISDDLRDMACAGQPGFLNTEPSEPPVSCDALEVEIVFSPPAPLPVDDPPFDLFLHRCEDRTHQVHRSAYPGTAQADPTLFGTCDDASTVPGGPYYVDADGVPFAITVDESGYWPAEQAPIGDAFPDLRAHFQSGGVDHPDWYQHPDYDFVYLPEPASPWLLACGAAALAALARRRA